MYGIILFVLLHWLSSVGWAKFTGNKVMGNPIVECSADSLAIRMATRKSFAGRVFVRGMSKDSACMTDYTTTDPFTPNTLISVKLPLGSCEMKRQRMLNPTGMQQSITLVVSFHPVFITKADKAFNIKCFYMDAAKVLTHSLQVSMLTTGSLQDEMEIPECEYSVRLGSPNGPLVQHANVGDKLFHYWRCSTDGNMGMMVRNCVVESGGGRKYVTIDSDGCPTDREVMEELTYNRATLEEAYVETEAFKFADDVTLYFQCEIKLCSKLRFLNGESTCIGLTPPNCGARRKVRAKRDARLVPGISVENSSSSEEAGVQEDPLEIFPSIDLVPVNEFVVLDVSQQPVKPKHSTEASLDQTKQTGHQTVQSQFSSRVEDLSSEGEFFGLTYLTTALAVIAGLVLVAFLLTGTLMTILCSRQHHPLDPFLFSKAMIQDISKYEMPESSVENSPL